ncbi:MAG TPA: PfkB family carbohydrate kinase [Fervidobacterium sp.]|nr:PfkB family carbohydrate kinase [Fervidobacterium sp.]HQE48129.1 PfkB family carbohydrate kinase [Fervidobacterium sp.]HUM41810.1 PfkB family carbohydrate kinase [Fervidobacterium sp.]
MVLFVGELLADMITEEHFENAEHFILKLGGSPGNIARYLSQLGKKARMLSRVGYDIIGKRIIKNLSGYGVDISYIQVDDTVGTTLVFVQRTEFSPRFFAIRGADRFLEYPNNEIFNGVEFVHFSCWPFTTKPVSEITDRLLEVALERNVKIAFDPNCRDELFSCGRIDRDRITSIMQFVEYSKPSLDDSIAIFGDVEYDFDDKIKYYIACFHNAGIKNVVLTAGENGAFVSDGKTIIPIPPHAKKVVDSTGAGDGFWAGIYYGLLEKKNFFDSCVVGSKIAGYILGFVGADVLLDSTIIGENW